MEAADEMSDEVAGTRKHVLTQKLTNSPIVEAGDSVVGHLAGDSVGTGSGE